MVEEKIQKNVSIVDRAIFIMRYMFFGFLVWSYYSTIFTIFRKGLIGIIIGWIALAMFFVFNDVINPIKMNHNEFGKYTNKIGALISIIFMACCLVPLFGIGILK